MGWTRGAQRFVPGGPDYDTAILIIESGRPKSCLRSALPYRVPRLGGQFGSAAGLVPLDCTKSMGGHAHTMGIGSEISPVVGRPD